VIDPFSSGATQAASLAGLEKDLEVRVLCGNVFA
jgi:hypothetical protein